MLLEYIKLYISEKRDIEEANKLGLALMKIPTAQGIGLALYDAQKIASLGEDWFNIFIGELRDYMLGMMVLKPHQDDCNGASEVKMVASQGFGEMMYTIASQLSPNGIMPDRGAGTTPKAQSVWKNKIAPNAKAKPFDNKENPVTPEKQDDCEIKHSNKRDFNINNVSPLDMSYQIQGNIDINNLLSNHRNFVQLISKKHGMENNKVEEILYDLSVKYFNSKLDFGSFFQ